jgi:D-alanyl-D-alanine carboxypeptidase
MTIGFAQINGAMYYFDTDGAMHTGWLDIMDERYYFSAGGVMQLGWLDLDGQLYYLDSDGVMQRGWIDVDGARYYLDRNGVVQTGWLSLDNRLYYLKPNGVMAKGMVEIEGKKNYFTGSGEYIRLVNPWNFLGEDYSPELISLSKYVYNNDQKVSEECYDDLMRMLDDCYKNGHYAIVVSSYRTISFQQALFNNQVNQFLSWGYSRAEAERRAAQIVAVPGTSEHHLGLAVDIVDNNWPYLEDEQENMPAQKWLMANSWKYGFILRYPADKIDVTGIIYEPWHYRYVGREMAVELYELGVCLEVYIDNLTNDGTTCGGKQPEG